jgi:nitrite reductase (NADH) small subunit/3-phenylpropionate/trans-cinnamate dioxygenase ferredoxin subunit
MSRKNSSITEFVSVAKQGDIPAGEGRAFEVGKKVIAVFLIDGQYYAIDDMCPHMGASLATGWVENHVVHCPWHGWRFDTRDGTWCDNRRVKIDTFPVRVVNHEIQVGTRPLARDNQTLTDEQRLSKTSRTSVKQPTKSESNSTRDESVSINDFQRLIRNMYYDKDVARGVEGTFMWFMEEVGELSTALRKGNHEDRMEEFADVIAWLTTMANVAGVDLAAALNRKYGSGCPGCRALNCVCSDAEKP